MSDRDDILSEKVREFSNDLGAACKAFTGKTPPDLYSRAIAEGENNVISIRLKQTDGQPGIIPLLSQGMTVIGVAFEYRCTWDSTNQFLAVQRSSIGVYPFANPAANPLFRVEYVRNPDSYRPSSHFHLHAHRDEFTHLMSFATKLDVAKTKKVEDYFRKGTQLSHFHFPTGGHRFRPCFEDILEVLRVEFKLDVDTNEWTPHLKSARLKWRQVQTSAVVRDDPQTALRVLTEHFGMPVPEGWDCPQADESKLTRS